MTGKADVNSRTAFGELKTIAPTPVVQIDALSGIRTKIDHETFTATGGSVSAENTGTGFEFRCQTGTSAGGYGLIRSKRFLRYRAGQGSLIRFTARFPTAGVPLSAIRAGAVATGTELSFGYDGENFGVLHRRGGTLEAQIFTVDTAATGSETVTITLNDVEFTVAVTSGTKAHNAFEIASDTFTGWNTSQNGDTVIFVATSVGAKTGSYTVSSTGDLDGTFVEKVVGAAVTDTWVYQDAWNIDKLDGTGPSQMVLDQTKGNVYQISFQYLGYGQIMYSVEDPGTGRFTPVHRVQYANAAVTPSLTQPIMKVGWFAASLGSTTPLEIYGASAAAFTEGPRVSFRNPDSHGNTKSNVTTTLTNIISYRVRELIDSNLNLTDVIPLLVSIAVDGTKPALAEIFINAELGGEPNWTYLDEGTDTIEYDTSATTVTNGSGSIEVTDVGLAKSGNALINLKDLDIRLSRGDVITIAVKATSGTTDVTAALTWVED